jgi:hypothetical protein
VIDLFDENGRKVQNKGPPQFAMRNLYSYFWDYRLKAEDVTKMMGKKLSKKAANVYVS